MPGVMIHVLGDPEHAPAAAEVIEGVRALGEIAGR
jgi:hypothetical protein